MDDIVDSSETEGRKAVTKILKDLFLKMDALEQKWLVRIILKDMRLGIGETNIFNTMHPDGKDFFEVQADLRKICLKLQDPTKRLHQLEVTLMDPFRPQLADRKPTIRELSRQLKDKQFFIETKYDGERCQLHKQGDKFKFFSRNGFDFTNDYDENSQGKFVNYFMKSLKSSVTDVILDGEMCAWSRENKCLLQKGEQFNIRQLKDDDPKVQQCLILYDIIHLDGKMLSNTPLKERKKIMERIIIEQEGRVQFCERIEASTTKEIMDSLNLAIDRREEGLVIKDVMSVYKPGER